LDSRQDFFSYRWSFPSICEPRLQFLKNPTASNRFLQRFSFAKGGLADWRTGGLIIDVPAGVASTRRLTPPVRRYIREHFTLSLFLLP
jgi:hypothetical protein